MAEDEATRAGGASRRRGAALEDAILDAAWTVLLEQGYSGFTFEAVAARAGTSRPVLYRRWATREDLLFAVLGKRWRRRIEAPDTGTLREDALTLLRAFNSLRGRSVVLLRVQLADYFRDSDTSFNELRDRIIPSDEGPDAFQVMVERAVERGELADRPRPPRVIHLPVDLVRHDLLMGMGALPDEAITGIVDDIWLPLLRG